jgi:itaconate CoA-transferase
MVLISIQNEREWAAFCADFLGEPGLPSCEGFRSNVERVASRAMVDAHLAKAFRALSRDACAAKLRAANTAYGFVNDVSSFSRHPALRRVMVHTPAGPVAVAAPAPRFNGGDRDLGRVPELGEHTVAVRTEFGG